VSAHALTLNAGSSSVKFGLFGIGGAEPERRAVGVLERIGGAPHLRARFADGGEAVALDLPEEDGRDLGAAVATVLRRARERLDERLGRRLAVVGHRIVHGGPDHNEPVRLTPEIVASLARLNALAA
jgi:acetate kinase